MTYPIPSIGLPSPSSAIPGNAGTFILIYTATMIHPWIRRIRVSLAASILVLIHGSSTPAQSPHSIPKIQFIPPPPPTIGMPEGSERGAGSRGPACKRYENTTALVPLTRTTQPIRWGLTTTHPTIWLYAPQGLAANTPLALVLQDEAGQNRSRTVLQTSETPVGVFSLSLPATAAPLQAGKIYRWSVSIYCDPDAIDIPVIVQGALGRVTLSAKLQSQLAATHSVLEQANLYAQNGVWYDALTTLGEELRRHEETGIASAWRDLLQQASLGKVKSAAIVPCCK